MEILIYGLKLKSDPLGEVRYVGQTGQTLKDRFRDHNTAWSRASVGHLPVSRWVKKHRGDVEIFLIEKCFSQEEADTREIFWIDELRTHVTNPGGLNVSLGGGGVRGYTFSRKPMEKGPKLNQDQVKEIKRRIWKGESNIEISKSFPVNNRTIGNIAREQTWKHVPWPTDLGDRVYFDKDKAQSRKMISARRDKGGRVIPGWRDD